MAVFQFEALDQTGASVKDTVEANSPEEAQVKIKQMGYYVTKLAQKKAKAAKGKKAPAAKGKKHPFTLGGVSTKQLTVFTRQLSTLQDAGLPVLRSLQILEGQMKPCKLKYTLVDVVEDVQGGLSMSDAFSKHPKVFDRLYVNMVKAGEAGGNLEAILQRLSDFKEKAQSLKRKVTGAMIYPSVVIFVACAIMFFILYYIVPKFKKIFEDFGLELPQMTQILIDTSTLVVNNWYMIPAIPTIAFFSYKAIRLTKKGETITDWIKLKLPVFGNITSKVIIARTMRTLGTLVASGVPILDAIVICRETSQNIIFERAYQKVYDSIREGDTIAQPLKQTRVVDDMVVNMVDVGEETGDLDKMLYKVADVYDEEVDVLVEGMVALLEPLMVVFLGVMVGFIVIALFMPLIKLLNELGK